MLSRKSLLARVEICIFILLINALAIDRGVELEFVSGLAALETGKAGSATLLPLADARPEIGHFLALRVSLVDLLAVVSNSKWVQSSRCRRTDRARGGHGACPLTTAAAANMTAMETMSETIFILVALVVDGSCGGKRGRGCRRPGAEMLARGSCS
jgi:hypothetical protein